jgi:hypothetical protein
MSRFILISLCFVVAPWTAHAALDPELDKPYRFRIVLVMAKHPLLTPVFEKRMLDELKGGFQAALGRLADVEAFNRKRLIQELDPAKEPTPERVQSIRLTLRLLGEVEDKGLDKAFKDWEEISDTKTHFVHIAFNDGSYEIQARQYDGLTGLPSPVVRSERTADRQFVARTAALMIDRDFGLVGTFAPTAMGTDVLVQFKGGDLGEPLDHWAEKGDIFAVAQLKEGRGVRRSFRVEWTVLQALENPHDGGCKCRVHERYQGSLNAGAGSLGFRCIKLGAIRAPFSLRLVDDTTFEPRAGVRVLVSSTGPDALGREEWATDSEGLIRTKKAYQNVAFLSVVVSGDKVQAQIPVPILDDRIIPCPLKANAADEARAPLDLRRRQWESRLDESLQITSELFKDLSRSGEGKTHATFLAKAQSGLKNLQSDLVAFTEERTSLQTAAKQLGLQNSFRLADGELRLQQLELRRTKLKEYIAGLEDVVNREKDPKRQELLAMAERAALLEGEADFGKAIALYEQILKEGANQPGLTKYTSHLEKLKQAWATKDDAHAAARAFVYETWPKLETAADMKARLEEANKAFQTCKAADDRLTPLRLLKANTAHIVALRKRLETVVSSNSQEELKEGQAITEVLDELAKLTREVTAFVNPSKQTNS